jgi:hypothetical protein
MKSTDYRPDQTPHRSRLARECAKLDPIEERELAEEGLIQSVAADDEDLAAIQEAIDDIENGDAGIPFGEFDREFRARHGL